MINAFNVTADAASALFAAHDGDMALVYMYMQAAGTTDTEELAAALCRTGGEIAAAQEKLKRLGLCASAPGGSARQEAAAVKPAEPEEKPGRTDKLLPAQELPQYSAADIAERAKQDPGYSAVIEDAKKVIGRSLSTNDMQTLFGIYDFIGLPTEVILMLISYVGMRYEKRYNGTRRPNTKAFEREAFAWYQAGIDTLEQAEEFISRTELRESALAVLGEAVGIRGRKPTPTEQKYILSWAEMGFDAKAVAMAYDRTVTNTGGLKWPYMDKIMQSWHARGLHTPEQIMQSDGRRKQVKAAADPGTGVSQKELDDILNNI